MSAVSQLNSEAEIYRHEEALFVNLNVVHVLADLVKTSVGPAGTLKMLVSGSGDVQITKDGNVFLRNVAIVHPTGLLVARAAVAQDDNTGDGTTSTIIFIDGLLRHSERRLKEGVHPRVLTAGLKVARSEALRFLDSFRTAISPTRTWLLSLARSAIGTKVESGLADHLASIVTDAVLTIKPADGPADLLMVEQLSMMTKLANDTQLVRGLVLDHGVRHAQMKRDLRNCYILAMNVSLEFENTEVNTTFSAAGAGDRERLAIAERRFVEDKVERIIALKRRVCTKGEDFLVVNMKGIDPPSLEQLYKAGISALRRAKRRNMERLSQACGGKETNSVDNLSEANLGFAGHVWETSLGEDNFTFVEELKDPKSVTILVKGPNAHTIKQIQDAIRDGLEVVNHGIKDGYAVPGAGGFESALSHYLDEFKTKVDGKKRLGVEVFAEACLELPRALATNAGHDAIDTLIALQKAAERGEVAGVDIDKGGVIDPREVGIWDSYIVKKNQLQSAPLVATQLLLVDEILKAGKPLK
jgi:T-complex protein 1 subunit zeta